LEAGSVLPSLNFPQLDFVKPSSGFHPVTWERVRKPLMLRLFRDLKFEGDLVDQKSSIKQLKYYSF
jgi:hypothetical protein